MVPPTDIPSPTKRLFAIPTPPLTINAPVLDEVDAVVSVIVTAPGPKLPEKESAVTIPLDTTSVKLEIPLTVNLLPTVKFPLASVTLARLYAL